MSRPRAHRPDETHESSRALVWLYSWGTEAHPHYSISVIRKYPDGTMNAGMTFSADSFPELRTKGRDSLPADLMQELEAALWKATKQLALPLDLPEPLPPSQQPQRGRRGC